MAKYDEQADATLRDELGVFGFSDKEIDVYLALLTRGEATTSTVSEDADVTQQAVYNITERLEDRGLVRINDHASPKTIRAVPPEKSMAKLSNRIDSITPALKDRFTDTKPKAPELKMIKSRKTALKRLRSAISQAQREVIVAIPEHVYPEIEPELQAAVERDLLVFLLIQDIDRSEETRSRFAGSADVVRFWDESIVFLYAMDIDSANQSALIGDADLSSGTHDIGDGVAVTQRHLTGSIHGGFFSAYWPAGTEVFITDPDPLPRTFKWFRQATFHAMLHQKEGTDLLAEIETDSGEKISGIVSQVRQAFVEPTTNDYTLETSFYLKTDGGEVSVGGPNSIIEEYEATSVTLQEA